MPPLPGEDQDNLDPGICTYRGIDSNQQYNSAPYSVPMRENNQPHLIPHSKVDPGVALDRSLAAATHALAPHAPPAQISQQPMNSTQAALQPNYWMVMPNVGIDPRQQHLVPQHWPTNRTRGGLLAPAHIVSTIEFPGTQHVQPGLNLMLHNQQPLHSNNHQGHPR